MKIAIKVRVRSRYAMAIERGTMPANEVPSGAGNALIDRETPRLS